MSVLPGTLIGSKSAHLKEHSHISRTSLNFSLKVFLAQPTLQQFLLPLNVCSTYYHVPDSSGGFLFNCYLPFQRMIHPISPNWIIG